MRAGDSLGADLGDVGVVEQPQLAPSEYGVITSKQRASGTPGGPAGLTTEMSSFLSRSCATTWSKRVSAWSVASVR